MPRLIFNHPEFGEQTCELMDGTVTLGRSRQNHLVVLDGSVSARHCEFYVYGSEVILRDHGARNGTFVDGVRVEIQTGVAHGQRLRFGGIEARLEIGTAAPADDSDLTACHAHCRARRTPAAPPTPPPRYPMILAARKADAPGALTTSMPFEPASVPAPLPITHTPAEPAPDTRSWRWVIILTSLSMLGLLWIAWPR